MHILRWLFLHPVIFAWVLAILAILLNYSVGGDSKEDVHHTEGAEMTEQHADAAPDEAHSEAAADVEAEAKQDTAATEEQAAPAEEKASEAAAAEQAAPAEAKVAEATEVAEQTVETAEADGKAATTAAVAAVATAATAVASGEAAAGQAEPAQTAATADETTQASSEVTETATAQADATVTQDAAPAGTSNDDLLAAAREAYWSNDFERAAEFYQALLARDDQPGYKGELANVYWKQGDSQEAVQLYSDIAVWLKDQGRMAELQNIKVYVDLVDPAVGEKIGELLK